MLNHALRDLLHQLIILRVKAPEQKWAFTAQQKIQSTADPRLFCILYSQVSRYSDQSELSLTEQQQASLRTIIPNWSINHWTHDQLIRAYFLLSWPSPHSFIALIKQLIVHANIHELIAFYQALPLLPIFEELRPLIIDALRTNINSVFNAIALHNPYPMNHFSEAEWNQMVLKAIFIGSSIKQIIGLEARNNSELRKMFRHFCDERLAAQRAIPTEIYDLLNKIN